MASFQPQFAVFPLPQQTTTFASEAPTLQLNPPPLLSAVAPEYDPRNFNGAWGAFDFATIDPGLGRDYAPQVEVGIPTAAVTLPPVFKPYLPNTPVSQHGYSISDSEGSTSSQGHQVREGPKEWIPRRRKRTKKEAESGSAPATKPRRPELDEAGLFDHFRNCSQDDFVNEQDAMWGFQRFVSDFVQKCSPHCPMRLAVLAWTAKHSTINSTTTKEADSPVDPTVAIWYSKSSEQIEKLFNMPDPTLEIGALVPVTNVGEVIIATCFFLNRYDVLCGALPTATARLERITAWLAKHTGDLNMSAFASKLLIWSGYLQLRISVFSKYHLPFPSLLDVLCGRQDYHLILERSHNFYLDMFGHAYPSERLAEDVERIPAALHLHETFRLMNSILRYRTIRHDQSQTDGHDFVAWEGLAVAKRTVDDEVHRIEADFDLAVAINSSAAVLCRGIMAGASSSGSRTPESTGMAPQSPPTPPHFQVNKLSRVSLHWLTAYAAFMSTKILWSRLIRLDIRTDEASAAAVESILRILLLLRRSEGRKLHARDLPNMLWPLPLFVAGMETVDEVWADWVKLFISDVEGRKEGEKSKMLGLLEEVRRRQDEAGKRVYVTDLMAEQGQGTELFVF
ncbi:hypothetical protein OQA88_6490 [Cercophora sp. LCS_1]